MQSLALVIHVVLAVSVVGLVLMQHGKGADAGAAFGSGASATVFGARGSASFLTRATTILATLFFITSLFLFYLAAHRDGTVRSVTDVPGIVEEVPAAPAVTDLPGGVSPDADTTGAAGGSDADVDMPEPAAAPPAPPTVEDTPVGTD
ncbi:MAG: preprotein translocase subunit SecG [Granulosicoccus sp.]